MCARVCLCEVTFPAPDSLGGGEPSRGHLSSSTAPPPPAVVLSSLHEVDTTMVSLQDRAVNPEAWRLYPTTEDREKGLQAKRAS